MTLKIVPSLDARPPLPPPYDPPPTANNAFSLSPLHPTPFPAASLFGSSMDVLTQLEQACAHGCVLLSESFAVALRPSDPALVFPLPPPPSDSDSAAAAPPSGPAEGVDNATAGSSINTDPLLLAARAPVSTPSSSSLRLASPPAAASPQGAVARSVTVRRLGLRRVPTFSPSALLPGAVSGVGATSGARSGAVSGVISASAGTGDAFDLLPASDMDLIGARRGPLFTLSRWCQGGYLQRG